MIVPAETLKPVLFRVFVLLVGLLLCQLIVNLLPGGPDSVRFERDAIIGGEWYRLVTAHLAHINWAHALMNAAGLSLASAVLGLSLRQIYVSFVICAVVISGGLLVIYPEVDWYLGYSGILYGQIALGLSLAIKAESGALGHSGNRIQRRAATMRATVLAVVLVAVIGHILLNASAEREQLAAGAGRAIHPLIEAPVLHEAHILGVSGGMGVFMLSIIKGYTHRRRVNTKHTRERT